MNYMKPYELTVMELKSSRVRLKRLEQKKEELLTKYCSPKSPSTGEHNGGSGDGKSNQERYVDAITTPRDNGYSIDEEIEMLHEAIRELENDIREMASIYSNLSSIEADLLKELGQGTNVTQAISKVADRNYVSDATMWRRYKKMKKKG